MHDEAEHQRAGEIHDECRGASLDEPIDAKTGKRSGHPTEGDIEDGQKKTPAVSGSVGVISPMGRLTANSIARGKHSTRGLSAEDARGLD